MHGAKALGRNFGVRGHFGLKGSLDQHLPSARPTPPAKSTSCSTRSAARPSKFRRRWTVAWTCRVPVCPELPENFDTLRLNRALLE